MQVMLLELPRLLTLVAATLLLRLGHTRGGIGELRALAEVSWLPWTALSGRRVDFAVACAQRTVPR